MGGARILASVAGFLGLLLLGMATLSLLAPTSALSSQRITTTSTSLLTGPSLNITLYAGETGKGLGFGLSPTNITSPGPEIHVKLGYVIRLTLAVVGRMPHALIVVDSLSSLHPAFVGAEVGSPDTPLSPGQTGLAIFKADRPGVYYYICPVAGHAQLGMWGGFIVEG